jgi:hypothetical protein
MKSSRTGAPIAAVSLVLSLALAACGGGSGDDSSTSASTTPTTEKTKPTTTSDQASGSLTPPGTQLKVGEKASVAWVPFSEDNPSGGEKGIALEVSVEAIETGSIDDFENVELEADEKSSTPYYVKLQIEAASGTEPPPDEEPYIAFDAIDDRGQEQSSVTFLGEFERCDNADMPRPFTDGDSYETCLTYLVPSGGSIEEVRWDSGPSEGTELTPYYDDPIVWKGS